MSRTSGSFSAAHVAGKTIGSSSRLPRRELCETVYDKKTAFCWETVFFLYFFFLPPKMLPLPSGTASFMALA